MHVPKKHLGLLCLNVFVFAVETKAWLGMNHGNLHRQTGSDTDRSKIIRYKKCSI